MRCEACGFESPEGLGFCGRCGKPLTARCAACGQPNAPGFRFCGHCGTALAAQPSATRPPPAQPAQEPAATKLPRTSAERRQLTVLFADLVGSANLTESMDPEDLRLVLREYQGVCSRIVKGLDGHLAKYLGDGVLVYFGYPRAHEDDAVRAVRAGLAIMEGVQRLRLPPGVTRPSVRVGIDTGFVIAGDMDEGNELESMAVVGQTPNIAARLQHEAAPDTVLISAATRRLVGRIFDLEALGQRSLKGITEPLAVHRVLSEATARSRSDTPQAPPLIGREREAELVRARWASAREGQGQVVLISGDPGIGKSRLVDALKADAAAQSGSWLTECRCSAYHQNTALYPVIDLLQRVVLQMAPEMSGVDRLDRIDALVTQYGHAPADASPLLADLLSIPRSGRYPPDQLTPDRRRQRTLDLLVGILLDRASRQPVLFVMEDLHWADPTTLELLDRLVEQVPSVSLLALFTSRREFVPRWAVRSYYTQLSLNRLARAQIEQLIRRMAEERDLPAAVVEQLVRKTDGVPLFVEELTRMVLESGLLRRSNGAYELTGPLPSLAIPATLQESLAARLDRLEEGRSLAQLASVIGHEFSFETLQAVTSLPEQPLRRALDQLVDAELLNRRGSFPRSVFTFRHALLQEAAYNSLLRSVRQQHHRRVAQVLEAEGNAAQLQPEVLARHYTEAGETGTAIAYWLRAGQHAFHRSANVEAISHLERGLELVRSLADPDSPARAQDELPLQLTLGMATVAIRGYTAPEVEAAFGRALELCRRVGDTAALFPVLWGLWAYYLVRADYGEAHRLSRQLFDAAGADPGLLLEAHVAAGQTVYWCDGDLSAARRHFEAALAVYEPDEHRAHLVIYLQDPSVVALSYLSWILLLQGDEAGALAASRNALEHANRIAHPYSRAYAMIWICVLQHLREDPAAAASAAAPVLELAIEHGFPNWIADAQMLRGWGLSLLGSHDEGIELLRQGLATWAAIGARIWETESHALLVDALRAAGRPQEALATVDQAIAFAEERDERLFIAELLRRRAELLVEIDGAAAAGRARQLLEQAMARAAEQHAPLWVQHARASLERLPRPEPLAEAR